MYKILCPVDFSDTSLNAIEFAARIADKYKASLTLLHVFTEDDFAKSLDEKDKDLLTYKELLERAKKKLKTLSDTIIKSKDFSNPVQCDNRLEMGILDEIIVAFAREEKIGLIVIGTTGISQINLTYIGSNTRKIIEESEIPVLSIPQQATYNSFRKIVYATDLKDADKVALQEVVSFATIFDGRINVVHVNSKYGALSSILFEETITDLTSFIQYNKIRFQRIEGEDDPGFALEKYMDTEQADLLVLLTRHRNFFENIFHKSLSKRIGYITKHPLLIIKE